MSIYDPWNRWWWRMRNDIICPGLFRHAAWLQCPRKQKCLVVKTSAPVWPDTGWSELYRHLACQVWEQEVPDISVCISLTACRTNPWHFNRKAVPTEFLGCPESRVGCSEHQHYNHLSNYLNHLYQHLYYAMHYFQVCLRGLLHAQMQGQNLPLQWK